MCQYRYYYYAGCQHQETILHNFCSKAITTDKSVSSHVPSRTIHVQLEEGDSDIDDKHDNGLRPSQPGFSKPKTSSTLPSGLVLTSLTSIQKPVKGRTYSQHTLPEYHSCHHHSEPGIDSASIPSPLARTDLCRQTPNQISDLTSVAANVSIEVMTRKIPQSSSSSIPPDNRHRTKRTKSSDTTANTHVRSHNSGGIQRPSRNFTSPDTALADPHGPERQQSAFIANHTIALGGKAEENPTLDGDQSAFSAHVEYGCDILLYVNEDGHLPESAAARLQRCHEADEVALLDTSEDAAMVEPASQSSPRLSLSEFPELSKTASERVPMANTPTAPVRKLSYANMATTGLVDVTEECDFSAIMTNNAASEASVMMTPQSKADVPNLMSTVFLPTATTSPTLCPVADPADIKRVKQDGSANSKRHLPGYPSMNSAANVSTFQQTARQSPHFAQPTKSFKTRTNETLRQHSMSPDRKDAITCPLTKTSRTRTHVHHKRKPLPGGWSAPLEGQGNPETLTNVASSVIPGSRDAISKQSSPRRENPLTRDEKVRRSAVSYMSPTKATTQRTIATLRQSPTKTSDQRPQQNSFIPETTLAGEEDKFPEFEVDPTSIASSDSSLDHIIVDLPIDDPFYSFTHHGKGNSTSLRSGKKDETSSVETGPKFGNAAMVNGDVLTRRGTTSKVTGSATITSQTPVAGLPSVANAVSTRRGSHGHLLHPIRARLSKHGLLNEQANGESLPATNSKKNLSRERSGGVEQSSQTHCEDLIQWEETHVSTRTPKRQAPGDGSLAQVSKQSVRTGSFVTTIAEAEVSDDAANGGHPKRSPTTTLRATAQEFTPLADSIDIPLSIVEETARDDPLAFRSDEDWYNLPHEIRKQIIKLREGGGQVGCPTTRFWEASLSRFLPVDFQNLCNDGDNPSPLPIMTDASPLYPYQISSTWSGGRPAASYRKSKLSPDKEKKGRWIIQSLHDDNVQARFGRSAPPPNIHLSSITNLDRAQSSALSAKTCGWIGGDGREIQFVHSGNPASRFAFIRAAEPPTPQGAIRYLGGRTGRTRVGKRENYSRSPGKQQDGGRESDDDAIPLAPRSMRQWAAARGGGADLRPCGDVEITDAVEMMPADLAFGGGYGWCTACG